MTTQLDTVLTTSPVIPVIVIERADDAVPLAEALVRGGLNVLEITLRSEHGLTAIAAIKKHVPGAIVGAGTVLSAGDFQASVDAGAEFIVSPGTTAALLKAATASGTPLLPGVATPSEAMTALEHGLHCMKFFPAEAAGGTRMLKAIAGPMPQIKFCPTGGINLTNVEDYLALENVLCVGGTWMLDSAAIRSGDWAQIEAGARAAAGLSTRR